MLLFDEKLYKDLEKKLYNLVDKYFEIYVFEILRKRLVHRQPRDIVDPEVIELRKIEEVTDKYIRCDFAS